MLPLEKVKRFMEDLSFSLEIILFDDENTSTSPLAAKALGVEVGQIAKSLVFQGKKKDSPDPVGILVVTSGDVKVDIKRLKDLVGFKLRFANGDEAYSLTGFPPGGVCPFALPAEISVYIDSSLNRFSVVYAAAGTANSAVPITVEQLLMATEGQMCDVCVKSDR